MRNWEIKSRGRFCSSCGRPFMEEQIYHSLLEKSDSAPERIDICERCWDGKDSIRRGSAFAYWQSRFKRFQAPAEEEKIKKNLVHRLLEKYIGSKSPEHVNLCYVLALLEERKKNFIVRGASQDDDGNRIIVYEQAASGSSYLIRDPGLSLARADEVEEQVRTLLAEEEKVESAAGGTETPGTAPEPASADRAQDAQDREGRL